MFKIGQPVICICDDWGKQPIEDYVFIVNPRKGHKYTVRDVNEETGFLCFEEIENAGTYRFGNDIRTIKEVYWRPDWFRPIVSRPASIEVFEKLLVPTKRDVIA